MDSFEKKLYIPDNGEPLNEGAESPKIDEGAESPKIDEGAESPEIDEDAEDAESPKSPNMIKLENEEYLDSDSNEDDAEDIENMITAKSPQSKKMDSSAASVVISPIIVEPCCSKKFQDDPICVQFLQDEYNIDHIDIFSVRVIVSCIEFNNLKNPHLGITVMNGIRRVLTDELEHCHFTLEDINIDDSKTDLIDEYISKEYLELQLSNMPLIYGAKKKIASNTFSLNITNTSTEKIIVICNHLDQGSNIIMDPTGEICTLHPGKRIAFTNLKIKDNYGYKFAGATLTANARYRYLDLKTRSLEEMNMPENRLKSFAHESGYSQSSLIAAPLQFELSFDIKSATKNYKNEAKIILHDSINTIIERLKNILIILSQYIPGENNIYISESPNSDTKTLYTIKLLNETHTIGALIVSLLYSYTSRYNISDENELSIFIYLPSEIDGIAHILSCVKYGIDLYKEIKNQFK